MRTELTIAGIAWQRLVEPTGSELAAVARDVPLEAADRALLGESLMRATLVSRPAYELLRVEVPVFDRKLRASSGVALDCIVLPDQLITLQARLIPVLEKLVDGLKRNPDQDLEVTLAGPADLLKYLLRQIHHGTLRKLDRLHKYIDIAEDAVFQGNERKMVEEISLLMRDVSDLRKIIRPQRRLFQGTSWQELTQDLGKVWDGLETLQESVTQLANTNSTLLQHKENELLRLLAMYSALVVPLWILITPFVPTRPEASVLDITVYWGVLAFLGLALIFIFARFRGKRIL